MKKISSLMTAAVLASAVSAQAATLVEYDLTGAPGNQAFTAGAAATNLTALNLTRGAGLTATSAGNSFSASGWEGTAAGALSNEFFQFGFSVAPGYQATLDDLYIGTRSSNTGPGTIGVFSSLDNYATAITTISQTPGSNFVNSVIDLSSLGTVTGDLTFRLIEVNNTAANNGITASGGTFRVTGYFVNNAFDRNFQITGTVSAIPEPSMLGLVALAAPAMLRRRRA